MVATYPRLTEAIDRAQGARRDALFAVRAALDAADPRKLVGRAISLEGGTLAAGGRRYDLDAYRKVVSTFPEADIAPQAQFMVGFIYSEELKNYDEAEKAFRDLLQRYPRSELAASAQWMVDHMRTEEAPNFPGADSLMSAPGGGKGTKK